MEGYINKNIKIPYYLQLKNLIISKIVKGEFNIGDKIWSENEFSKKYNLNILTVRRAISEVRKEGMVYTVKGVGTFICHPELEFDISKYLSLGRALKNKGITEEIKVLNKEIVNYKESIFKGFDIKKMSSKLVYLERVRTINDDAIEYEEIFLNYDLCNSIINNKGNEIIYNYLVKVCGISFKSIEEHVEPKNLNLKESKNLGKKEGDIALLITRVAHDYNDTCVEFTKAIIRGDKCRYLLKIK